MIKAGFQCIYEIIVLQVIACKNIDKYLEVYFGNMPPKREIEECWLKKKRSAVGAAEAALLCRKCERLEILGHFSLEGVGREEQLFLSGFRFALAEIAIQLGHLYPLSEEESEYIQCLEIQTKCSIDRGVSATALEESINQMMEYARTHY